MNSKTVIGIGIGIAIIIGIGFALSGNEAPTNVEENIQVNEESTEIDEGKRYTLALDDSITAVGP